MLLENLSLSLSLYFQENDNKAALKVDKENVNLTLKSKTRHT